VSASFIQTEVSQVPTSDEAGVQLMTLPGCHAGEVMDGIQLEVPTFLRKNAYCFADPVPPLPVAVHVMAVP
jgi:hypothetical protein